MYTLLLLLHIVAAVMITALVLVQQGRGVAMDLPSAVALHKLFLGAEAQITCCSRLLLVLE